MRRPSGRGSAGTGPKPSTTWPPSPTSARRGRRRSGGSAPAERAGRKEIPVGSLEPARDYTNVADVVVPYRLLVERGEPGEVYNVCSGVGGSVAEVADALLPLARHAIELVPDPALLRPVEVPRLVGDNHRLREATGWAPAVSFEETLA